jgi:hypothetical protein
MKLILLLISFTVSAAYIETTLFSGLKVDNATATSIFDVSDSTGFSVQESIVCTGACNFLSKAYSSLDGAIFQEIPSYATTTTANKDWSFNMSGVFFRYVKITLQETTASTATYGTITVKSGKKTGM